MSPLCHRPFEILQTQRLGHVQVEAGVLRPFDVLWLGVAAERYQGDSIQLRCAADCPRDLESVHLRQADVAKDDIGPERLRLLETVASAQGYLDHVIVQLERLL